MKIIAFKNDALQQIGFGLTCAALTGAFSLCACAVTGQGLSAFLLCCTICILFSLKSEKTVFAPDPLLLVPAFYIFGTATPLSAGLSLTLGAFIFLALKKALGSRPLPSFAVAGIALGLTLGATVLLTNNYFGIGASGETPFEMLRSYRSLGFHPNFRGLLYGTVTLFTMITFSFKFKRLNKYLPAPFVTILIPFILNLFLNPVEELTTIDESVTLTFGNPLTSELARFTDISTADIPHILKSSVAFGGIFYVLYQNDSRGTVGANALNGVLSSLPLKKYSVRGFGKIAGITALAVIFIVTIAFSDTIRRLPMHCAGSMLIVSAWQSLPFSELAKAFGKRQILRILAFAVCSVSFLLCDPFTAVLITFIILLTADRKALFQKKGVQCNENNG